MPSFIRTKKQEEKWSKAKRAAEKSKGSSEQSFTDRDWALVNSIYQKMSKSLKNIKSKDNDFLDELKSILIKAKKKTLEEDEAENWLRENDPAYQKEDEYSDVDPYSEEDIEPELGGDLSFDEDQDIDPETYGMHEFDPDLEQTESDEDYSASPSKSHLRDIEQLEGEEKPIKRQEQPTSSKQQIEQDEEDKPQRFPDPTPELLDNVRDHVKHWLGNAELNEHLNADKTKNPHKYERGKFTQAATTAHVDKSSALEQLKNSDKFRSADKFDQMDMLHDFETKWHTENPNHLSNSIDLLNGARIEGVKAKRDYLDNKEQDISHIAQGGSASEGSSMSLEEALQHAGGEKTEEGTTGTVVYDPATMFAKENKEFLRQHVPSILDKVRKRKEKLDKEIERHSEKTAQPAELMHPSEVIQSMYGDNPHLKDPNKKSKINDFFKLYMPMVGIKKRQLMNELGLDKNFSQSVEGENLAATKAIYSALHDWDPNKAAFRTHVGNKIKGELRNLFQDVRAEKGVTQAQRELEQKAKKMPTAQPSASALQPPQSVQQPKIESSSIEQPKIAKQEPKVIIRRALDHPQLKNNQDISERYQRIATLKKPKIGGEQ